MPTPDRIAAALVNDGYATRKPAGAVRCHVTIELAATPDGWGNLYVTPRGAILRGELRRTAKPLAPELTRRITEGLE